MEEVKDSSQNSDLGKEESDKIEAQAQAENTKRATSWGIKKFEKWCEKRQLNVDLNSVTSAELNEVLRKFYAEVKSEKGQPLTPSTLTGIRAAIHRKLTSAPFSRTINILQDKEFLPANKMFEAKCKLYTKEMNPKPMHKSAIAAGDMTKLREYFSGGLGSTAWTEPERLLEFVWFSICFYFGRRGREGWRELTKQSFGIKKDDSGARYVTEMQTEQTKNYQGGSKQKDQSYSDVRMYENSSPLDPVSSFEFYILRLNPNCQALFQTPNKHFKKEGSQWFRNEPLGKNKIAKLMENISLKAELSEKYTNHCIRASTVTSLFQRGVDAKQICEITKHKDERSLTHYISQTSSAQKRHCSRLLQEAFDGHSPSVTSQESHRSSTNSESSNIAGASAITSVSQSLQSQFFSLAQPYPNCTQHIQIGTLNIYQSAGPSHSTESETVKRRRVVIESDSE